jgi:hypothetical protein
MCPLSAYLLQRRHAIHSSSRCAITRCDCQTETRFHIWKESFLGQTRSANLLRKCTIAQAKKSKFNTSFDFFFLTRTLMVCACGPRAVLVLHLSSQPHNQKRKCVFCCYSASQSQLSLPALPVAGTNFHRFVCCLFVCSLHSFRSVTARRGRVRAVLAVPSQTLPPPQHLKAISRLLG